MSRQPATLLVKVIAARIAELAAEKGLERYRVDYKRNARGELVIALIIAADEPLAMADRG